MVDWGKDQKTSLNGGLPVRFIITETASILYSSTSTTENVNYIV